MVKIKTLSHIVDVVHKCDDGHEEIFDVLYDNGTWYLVVESGYLYDNPEIRFCPFCGKDLKTEDV